VTFVAYEVADKNIISKLFDNELTLINLANGQYFAAGGSAVDFWELAAVGAAPETVVEAIVTRYDASADVVRADIDRVAELFIQNGLIKTAAAKAININLPPPAAVKPWKAGWLEVYGDMKDLLLLDPIHDVEQEWPEAKKD